MKFNKIALIGGARPNFMKIAPLYRELLNRKIDTVVINTGQHFSANMNDDFLQEFAVKVHHHLEPRHDNPSVQIADIMLGLGDIFAKEEVDLVIVVGDVNSTLAAGVCANKMGIKLCHVEAGLRSRNYAMPEELNRIVVDNLSDYLLASCQDGVDNLKNEKVHGQIDLVGNIMIDNLYHFLPDIKDNKEEYFFCTLHRMENVDHKDIFTDILKALEEISKDAPIYLPLHPRTKKMAEEFGLMDKLKSIFKILPPLSYKESLAYQKNAKLVLTDSGGIQEETSVLGVPCLTLRSETERPITVEQGTNIIGGVSYNSIMNAYKEIKNNPKAGQKIELWDGKTAARIIDSLMK